MAAEAGGSASDLDWGAFSAAGPWRLERDRLAWDRDVDALRERCRDAVATWTRVPVLPPLGRFAEAALAIGGALLAWRRVERPRGGEEARRGLARRLRHAFERLGPTYIKLGQIVSSGKGIFPDELVDEFRGLRDRVPAEPFEAVRAVVEADLGRPLERVFARFERDPLAAASIAQVHAATLAGGEDVVVKVQRPRVEHLVRRDLAALSWIAPRLVGKLPVAALANPPQLIELFAETILEELDFRLEARNMLDVASVLRDAGQTIVVVPRPHPELVTRRVLVMERLHGRHVEDAAGLHEDGVDPAALLRSLFITFLEGAMIYGVFHGDLHAGNLLVTPEGRVALFDYGMTGRMEPQQRLAFFRLMVLGAANDLRGQLEAFRDLGAFPSHADLDHVLRVLKADQPVRDPTRMAGEELIREIEAVVRGLLAQGARLPKHLMLYLKNLIFFDGAIARVAPDLDMLAEVARIQTYFATTHGARIQRELGLAADRAAPDLSGARRSMGLEGDVASISHRELRERRRRVQERIDAAKARGRSREG